MTVLYCTIVHRQIYGMVRYNSEANSLSAVLSQIKQGGSENCTFSGIDRQKLLPVVNFGRKFKKPLHVYYNSTIQLIFLWSSHTTSLRFVYRTADISGLSRSLDSADIKTAVRYTNVNGKVFEIKKQNFLFCVNSNILICLAPSFHKLSTVYLY